MFHHVDAQLSNFSDLLKNFTIINLALESPLTTLSEKLDFLAALAEHLSLGGSVRSFFDPSCREKKVSLPLSNVEKLPKIALDRGKILHLDKYGA